MTEAPTSTSNDDWRKRVAQLTDDRKTRQSAAALAVRFCKEGVRMAAGSGRDVSGVRFVEAGDPRCRDVGPYLHKFVYGP